MGPTAAQARVWEQWVLVESLGPARHCAPERPGAPSPPPLEKGGTGEQEEEPWVAHTTGCRAEVRCGKPKKLHDFIDGNREATCTRARVCVCVICTFRGGSLCSVGLDASFGSGLLRPLCDVVSLPSAESEPLYFAG